MPLIGETELIGVVKLVVGGWRFHSTYDSEKSAYETYRNLATKTPLTREKTVKPFGVHIAKIDPMTMEATEWSKVEGSSVWTRGG